MPHAALLGPSTQLDRCAPTSVADLDVTRLDESTTADAIVSARPDVVVAFSPSHAQYAALDETDLPTLVWWHTAPPSWASVAAERHRRTVLGGSSATPGAWRSVAVPVADHLFADSGASWNGTPVSAAWLGPPTARHAEYIRHFEDAAPGADDPGAVIAVNLHDDDRPACEHRALVALARGRLLLSEPLTPSRGLEPGIDYVEARTLDELHLAVENAVRAPDAFLRTRLRGRRKAELFRSSRVVARLVGDLLLELGLAPAARSGSSL